METYLGYKSIEPNAQYILDELKSSWDLRFGQMGIDVNNSTFLWYYELNIDETGNVSAIKKQPEIKNFRVVFKELFNRIKGN